MRSTPLGEYLGRVEASASSGGVRATRLRDHPDHPVGRHTHERPHLCVVLRSRYVTGAGAAAHGVEEVPAEPGSVLFHPAGTTHADRFLEPGGRFLALDVEPGCIGMEEAPPRSIQLTDPQALLLSLRIEEELAADGSTPAPGLPDLATELFSLAAQDGEARSEPGWLPRAEEALRDSIRGGIGLSELARALGIHPVTLTRGFRRYRGAVPSLYLGRLRVVRAIEILESSPDARLSEVALEAGFADQAHLTRRFREAIGVPPGRWRHRRR